MGGEMRYVTAENRDFLPIVLRRSWILDVVFIIYMLFSKEFFWR